MLFSATLFAAGAATAAVVLRRAEKPPRVTALEPQPAMAFDLREGETRRFLNYLGQIGRVHGLQPEKALFTDCWPNMEDTYAVSLSYQLAPDSYLEIRRNGISPEATARYWREYDSPLSRPAAQREKPPEPSRGQQPVSATDFAAIESGFLSLMHERVEKIDADFGGLHSDTVLLESCRNGHYGVFARTRKLNQQDEPVIALARQMRAAAGLPPEDPDNTHSLR